MLATKSDLDDVSNHLIGRSVEVLDAFRLGRKPYLPNAASDPTTPSNTRPRPPLMKSANAWDRHLLLASRRKLKNFTKYKLFLREDLSPDERHRKRSSGSVGTVTNTHPPTVPSQATSSDTTNKSAIPGADRIRLFQFTLYLLWLSAILLVSASIIAVGGLLVNIVFLSDLKCMISV